MFSSQSDLRRVAELLEGYQATDTGKKSNNSSALIKRLTLEPIVQRAGLSEAQLKKHLTAFVMILIAIGLAAFLTGKLLLLLLMPLAFFIEYQTLNKKAFQRALSFERDYTALLLSIASAVKTGIDPMAALSQAQRLFTKQSEVYHELVNFNALVDRGATEEFALSSFASTISHPDVPLFTTAFILARREGSSLAECLQRLAKVTRQRQSFRRKSKASIAMQRLSAFGIVGCAILIGFIQYIGNPLAVKAALADSVGSKCLMVGAGLVLTGFFWMLSLTRQRI